LLTGKTERIIIYNFFWYSLHIWSKGNKWFEILQVMCGKNFIYFVLFLIYLKLVETLTWLR
jgi:hypothetical protein